MVLDAKTDQQLEQATQALKTQADQSQLFLPVRPQLDPDQFAQALYQHKAGLLSKTDQADCAGQDHAALTEQGLLQLMSPGHADHG